MDLVLLPDHLGGVLFTVIAGSNVPERDRIGRMFGVALAGLEIGDLFDIAMVGRDDEGSACL